MKRFNDYIDKDRIISGSPKTGNYYVTRGLLISTPTLENPSIAELNLLEADTRSFLKLLTPQHRLKISVRTGKGNYQAVLNEYFDETRKYEEQAGKFAIEQRDAQFCQLQTLLDAYKLRDSEISLFLSVPIRSVARQIESEIEAAYESMTTVLNEIIRMFKQRGGEARTMDAEALHRACWIYYNPLKHESECPAFDQSSGIQESCLSGDMVPIHSKADVNFACGDCYHGFISVRNLPPATTSGLSQILSSLEINGYAYSVDIEPLDRAKVVDSEEAKISKLRRALSSTPSPTMEAELSTKQERVHSMLQGDKQPFQAKFTLHAWAATEKELQEKLAVLQSGIIRMGARPYLHGLPTSSRNHFLAGCPGSNVRAKAYWHYLEDINLAHLILLNGGKSIDVGNDVLMQGSNGSLLGINLFPDGSVSHTAIFGKTNYGKSVLTNRILNETSPRLGKVVAVEAGYSYSTLFDLLPDSASLILKNNSNSGCFNYLSTFGLAVTPEHITDVAKVVGQLSGTFLDVKASYRRALIQSLVSEFFEHWNYRSLDEVTHSHFHDWLFSICGEDSDRREDVVELAGILKPYRRDQPGCNLFDGVGGISLNKKALHIELSHLENEEAEFRAIAAFIIIKAIRTTIINMPRDVLKVIVIEELSWLKGFPGGFELVRDFLDRLRRYGAAVCIVTQTSAGIDNELMTSIAANTSQQFFLGQTARVAAKQLQEAFDLPDAAVDAMVSFEKPSRQEGAAFLHREVGSGVPRIRTGYNIAPTAETLYVASSSPDVYEARELAKANYASPYEAVKGEAPKFYS